MLKPCSGRVTGSFHRQERRVASALREQVRDGGAIAGEEQIKAAARRVVGAVEAERMETVREIVNEDRDGRTFAVGEPHPIWPNWRWNGTTFEAHSGERS